MTSPRRPAPERTPAPAGPPRPAANFASVARSLGELRPCAGNQPLNLDDPDTAWLVEHGAVDVFMVEYRAGRTASAFKHMTRARQGRLLFGAAPDADTAARPRLLVKGLPGVPGARLRQVPLAALLEHLPERQAASVMPAQIDAWIRDLAEAVVRDIDPRPGADHLLTPGPKVAAEGVVSSERGVVWLRGRDHRAAYLGTEESGPGPSGLMPVSPGVWVTLPEPAEIEGRSSREIALPDLLFHHLPEFHRLALEAEALNRMLLLADEANLQRDRVTWRRQDEASARAGLFTVVRRHRDHGLDDGSALLATLRIVGRHEGITIRAPQGARVTAEFEGIVQASGVRVRSVRLAAEARWWLGDSGALLAFRRDDQRPLALLPSRIGGYRSLDPVSGARGRMTAATARDLDEEAWMLYRPLPVDRPAGGRDLLRVARRKLGPDLAQVGGAGLAAGLAALVPAAALGILADTLVPAGETGPLVQMTGMLFLLAALAGLLNMLRGTAMMRIEGRAAARAVAGLWDRLLRLRPTFFRRFTAGELATRASSFQTVRDQVSGMVSGALLSVLFLLPTFALVFFHNVMLGWVSLGLGLAALGLTTTLGLLQIEHHRRRFDALRRLSGHLFQLINGVGKLRAAGAEGSAYAWWARRYREQKLAEIRISGFNEHLAAFGIALPALWSAVVILFASTQDAAGLSLGDFLVIYTASTIFVLSLAGLGASFEAVAALIPAGEQGREILAEPPESSEHHGAPPPLAGEIHFDHVSFRYSDAGPLVLDDVSIRAKPGEFIAVVGESGSGKSTLMRLALGLETPLSGTVYYDGHDLSRLNHESVRRQLGVVMQENALPPGTVLDSINGVDDRLTLDDAWRAARQAAVDQDIAAMPMGMYTPMGESGSTFSGGQYQRIRIAAALVNNPGILMLDEATSWLDTQSQTQTMESIEKANATRIVIAHRLSTIRKAGRIYVLQAGKVVQEGTFNDLSRTPGLFRRFVERQTA